MTQHPVIKLLKSFSKDEIRTFGEFVADTGFNKRKAVKNLYDSIKNFYPEFETDKIDLRKIFSGLYPGKKYKENSIRVLFHYLFELAKKFIAIKSFENNAFDFEYYVQTELFQRKQIYNVEKSVEKTMQSLNSGKLISEQFYFQKFRFEYEKLFYLSETSSGIFEKNLDKFDFHNLVNNLSAHFYIRTLKLYLNILNLEIIYNKKFRKENYEKIFRSVDVKELKDFPVVTVYYNLVNLLLHNENERSYHEIKKTLPEIIQNINIYDLMEIHINLKNYCKRKYSEGNNYFLEEEFRLINDELTFKTYRLNNEMPPLYYRNTVNNALRLEKFDWAKAFIENYKKELPEESSEDSYFYCLALVEFGLKNFDKSLELISGVKFEETYQKIESKLLQMMIYYEVGSSESLHSALEAIRQYLKNNSIIPDSRKTPYINFSRFLKSLVNFKNKDAMYELVNIKKNMLAESKLSNKKWLLEKADERLNSMHSKRNRGIIGF